MPDPAGRRPSRSLHSGYKESNGVATAHETVAAQLGMSAKTVQRARRLIECLRLAVTVAEGRYLTTAERAAAAARHGGRQDRAASTRALIMPREVVMAADRRPVENVHLPSPGRVKSSSPVIALYVPGTRPLHRISAGVKLIALAVFAAVVAIVVRGIETATVVFVATALLFPLAGAGWRALGRAVRPLFPLAVVLGVFLFLFDSPGAAWIGVARMLALLLLAALVTATTRMGELLEVLRRMLRQLRRFGVDADAVAFTLLLTVTMIPVVVGLWDRIGEAQRARGIRIGIRAFFPLLVQTLRLADDVGEALVARGAFPARVSADPT